jgi:hypothetical protein
MAEALTELQIKIIEYVSGNYCLDGIDIATHFQIPIDTSYDEIATLIDMGWLKREDIGVGTSLSVARPNPPAVKSSG